MIDANATDPLDEPRTLVAGAFYACTALFAAVAAALVAWSPALPPASRMAAALGFVAIAAMSLWAWRRGMAMRSWLVTTLGLASVASTGLSAWLMQSGVNSVALSANAVVVAMVFASAGGRPALAVGACAAALYLGMGWAEAGGALAGAPAVATLPLPRRIAAPLVVLALGMLGGFVIERLLTNAIGGARERERRFAHLLGMAADAYWEMDASLRLETVWRRRDGEHFEPAAMPPVPLWELPGLQFDADALDAHRADLEAHLPFRDLRVRWARPDGTHRHELVHGEPRFDGRGVFQGYWGVSRCIDDEVRARQAQLASESRYRDLFTRLPMPLVLHRRGRILDANAAAAAMFGYRDVADARGRNLLETYESEDLARARTRLAALERQPVGSVLPVAEFRLLTIDGRRLAVRATSVHVDAEDGTATLSSYFDETERLAAEDAVRRSEALLSHLVATSPDMISLSELDSGRIAMVNETFERMTGWKTHEVLGRSAAELGIWRDIGDRTVLVQALREQGRVENMPVQFVMRDGRTLTMALSAAPFTMDGRAYLVISARDITQAEQARLEREAILRNASIGIAMTRDRVFQMANPAFEAMFGWRERSIVGAPGSAVWPSAEAYVAFGAEVGPTLGRGEQIEAEREMARRDGTTFTCRLLARAVDPDHPLTSGTIWIAEDATERRRTERALAKARDDAEAANRAKSSFLANTSHEIRTPLNALVGLAHLARRADVGEGQRAQYLDQIAASADALSAVLSDILDLSKIEAGRLRVESRDFDLHRLLDELRRAYATLAGARGLTFLLDLDPAVPRRVSGDAVRVRQILANYLSNALKFTAQGSIWLVAQPHGEGLVRFEVHDSGPGIDAATRERLFRPFTQGDESTTRRYGGTGLGLSICRELAELMGGRVGVDSEPGAGCSFWVELPLAQGEEATTRPGLLDDASAGGALAGARVLLAEDNPVNMMIATAMLEGWGVEVTQAVHGGEAVEAVERAADAGRPFDAVLMDVQMPVMSGHDATARLRQRFAVQVLPIIALTAAALTSERDSAFAAGMNDFLTKPIDAMRLHDVLVRWVDRSAAPTDAAKA